MLEECTIRTWSYVVTRDQHQYLTIHPPPATDYVVSHFAWYFRHHPSFVASFPSTKRRLTRWRTIFAGRFLKGMCWTKASGWSMVETLRHVWFRPRPTQSCRLRTGSPVFVGVLLKVSTWTCIFDPLDEGVMHTFTYFSIIFIIGFRFWCQRIHRKSSARKKREELRGDPLHGFTETENKNTNEKREEVQRDISHELPDWQQKFRENLVDESTSTEPSRNPSKEVKTLPSHLMNVRREQKWNQVRGKHSVFTHFPKDPYCGICLKTKITNSSCRRRTGTVVPKAKHFGDLITAGRKVLSEECESRKKAQTALQ